MCLVFPAEDSLNSFDQSSMLSGCVRAELACLVFLEVLRGPEVQISLKLQHKWDLHLHGGTDACLRYWLEGQRQLSPE